jgi:hypothetical protein
MIARREAAGVMRKMDRIEWIGLEIDDARAAKLERFRANGSRECAPDDRLRGHRFA